MDDASPSPNQNGKIAISVWLITSYADAEAFCFFIKDQKEQGYSFRVCNPEPVGGHREKRVSTPEELKILAKSPHIRLVFSRKDEPGQIPLRDAVDLIYKYRTW